MDTTKSMQKAMTLDRKKMVLCMEYIARQLNDEDIFIAWLETGVADGDIPYGNLDVENPNLDYYIDSDTFAELMQDFLRLMSIAYKKDSGLFCGNVVSGYQS